MASRHDPRRGNLYDMLNIRDCKPSIRWFGLGDGQNPTHPPRGGAVRVETTSRITRRPSLVGGDSVAEGVALRRYSATESPPTHVAPNQSFNGYGPGNFDAVSKVARVTPYSCIVTGDRTLRWGKTPCRSSLSTRIRPWNWQTANKSPRRISTACTPASSSPPCLRNLPTSPKGMCSIWHCVAILTVEIADALAIDPHIVRHHLRESREHLRARTDIHLGSIAAPTDSAAIVRTASCGALR